MATETEKPKSDQPKSLDIANRGIKTGKDFADFMSCLMSDIVAGRVTPQVGNASCNAGGKLLKVVEMQYKYGDTTPGRPKTLILALGDDEPNPQQPKLPNTEASPRPN